jgi:hypothetical protein
MGLLRMSGACLAALLIAGCGASSAGGGLPPAVATGELHFVTCMRAHGINEPDPVQRPGHSGKSIAIPAHDPASRAAWTACGHYLQPLIELKMSHTPVISAAERLQLIHYAQCMREHGVSMLDPTPRGALKLGNLPGFNNSVGRYSPPFRFADEACRSVLPPAVRARDNGSGP